MTKSTLESVEVKLVQFAKSNYAKKLAERNDCDGFIQYCLSNIYHTTIPDILAGSTIVAGKKTDIATDVLVYTAWAVGTTAVLVAEVGGAAVFVVFVIGDEPGEEPGPGACNMVKAAIMCGGVQFGTNVTQRYCDLVQKESKKRREIANV